jgi:hypothetical protein
MLFLRLLSQETSTPAIGTPVISFCCLKNHWTDFYLFAKVTSALVGRENPDDIGLLEVVTEILNGISDVELQPFF